MPGFERRHGFAIFRHLEPQLPALLRLAVERLRYRRRAAYVAETQNLHLKVDAGVPHLQVVAGPDFTRGFGWLSVGLDPAEFARPFGLRARFEESGGPQPLVH